METHRLKEPTQCHLWQQENLRPEDLDNTLATSETFVEDSHDIRNLVTCNKCGQEYFYEFHEEVNMNDGEDSQYRTYVPISSREEVELLLKTDYLGILNFFPRLQIDWPAQGEITVKWIR